MQRPERRMIMRYPALVLGAVVYRLAGLPGPCRDPSLSPYAGSVRELGDSRELSQVVQSQPDTSCQMVIPPPKKQENALDSLGFQAAGEQYSLLGLRC